MERLQKFKGFSMIEQLAVIVVIGVLSIVIFGHWSMDSINLKTQATLFAEDLRYTQNLTITRGQVFSLQIISATSYQILDGGGNPVVLGSRTPPFNLVDGVRFTTIPINSIGFTVGGAPCDENGNLLTEVTTFVLGVGGSALEVTITPETGRITP